MKQGFDIDLSGTRVLVVDDDLDSREMLAAVLEHSGASVAIAGSAAHALVAYKEQHPHLIISDIGLPDQDGFDLLEKLRSLRPDGAHIPAIALTGYSRPDDLVRAGRAGFEAHLIKPVELPVMLTTVARVLHDSRSPR
jgi:CheY-like chemotaxis protein